MNLLGHLPPQIDIEFPVIYLKAYHCHTEPFILKLDGSHVCSLFLVTIGSTSLFVLKCCSLGRKVLGIIKTHMSPSSLCGAAVFVALAAAVLWCPSCRQVTGQGCYHNQTLFSTYITTTDQH